MGNSEFIPFWLLWENKNFGLLPESLEAVYHEVRRQHRMLFTALSPRENHILQV